MAVIAERDDDPPVCMNPGCRRTPTHQVVFRTARGAPPGDSGTHPRYVLSPRYCEDCATDYAMRAEPAGYANVTLLPL